MKKKIKMNEDKKQEKMKKQSKDSEFDRKALHFKESNSNRIDGFTKSSVNKTQIQKDSKD